MDKKYIIAVLLTIPLMLCSVSGSQPQTETSQAESIGHLSVIEAIQDTMLKIATSNNQITEEEVADEDFEEEDEGLAVEEIEYYTEDDVVMIAKTIYGEARSDEISREGKAMVAWTILNRYDAGFEKSISAVITAPGQFHGYSESFPVRGDLYEIAEDVCKRWVLEKQGADPELVHRELESDKLFFSGDGHQNYFY